eukprot:CAMPEP_0172595326 /NCGR_PEP_ID=MMETSP1068-20121228/14860_1 /TAXON_ID=35684 /ORGANISM="Pseudopedinella elastica, Strain CCMP716" /LENGTH=331 /DNA_ID=CAMNT_0013393781 /DNA_START=39 /DNA_END=1034 /DNA_ORIENTATION=+
MPLSFDPSPLLGMTFRCGLDYKTRSIFFTKNGRLIGPAFPDVPEGPFYATAGLHSRAMRISFRFSNFVYDLKSHFRADLGAAPTNVSSSLVHHHIYEYLLLQGFRSTLDEFELSLTGSGHLADSKLQVPPQKLRDDLDERSLIRDLIVGGRTQEAFARLSADHSTLLEALPELKARVGLQIFIEDVVSGKSIRAVQTAQEFFSGFIASHGFESRTQGHAAAEVPKAASLAIPGTCRTYRDLSRCLEEAMGLLAYDEVMSSPLNYLLSTSHAQSVADMVNDALVGHSFGSDQPRRTTALHTAMKQLLACNALQRELQGGGQMYALPDFPKEL